MPISISHRTALQISEIRYIFDFSNRSLLTTVFKSFTTGYNPNLLRVSRFWGVDEMPAEPSCGQLTTRA